MCHNRSSSQNQVSLVKQILTGWWGSESIWWEKVNQTTGPSKSQWCLIIANSHSLLHSSHCSKCFICATLKYSHDSYFLIEKIAQRLSKLPRASWLFSSGAGIWTQATCLHSLPAWPLNSFAWQYWFLFLFWCFLFNPFIIFFGLFGLLCKSISPLKAGNCVDFSQAFTLYET